MEERILSNSQIRHFSDYLVREEKVMQPARSISGMFMVFVYLPATTG